MTKENAYIDFIVNELRKGNVSFEKVFKLNLTKFNLTRPTFSKYWKKANISYNNERAEVERQKLSITFKRKQKPLKSKF